MTSFNPITQLPEDTVVLDTETTGFDPAEGHRIVEIAATRMRGGLPTGETYHVYINPERDVPQAAADVHGLTTERLKGEPVFADVVGGFLAFLGQDPFIAHNAPFDLKFLNAELERCGHEPIAVERSYDTVAVARRIFPGAQANLDALCRRFKIPLTQREKHSALIDTELLTEVVVEMGGGRQQSLFGAPVSATTAPTTQHAAIVQRPAAAQLDAATIEAHKAFVLKELGPDSVWAQIYAAQDTAAGTASVDTPNTEAA
jgi:DNA polymerase III subunit epsilon